MTFSLALPLCFRYMYVHFAKVIACWMQYTEKL